MAKKIELEGVVYREFRNQRTGKREMVKGYRVGSPAQAEYTARRNRERAKRQAAKARNATVAKPLSGLLIGILRIAAAAV